MPDLIADTARSFISASGLDRLRTWIRRFGRPPAALEEGSSPPAGEAAAPEFDLIIIGSGPTSLARAVTEARAGRSVLLLERDCHVGGAWAARPCFPGSESRYDVVAHLVSPFLEAHAMLNSVGVRMLKRPIYFLAHDPVGNVARFQTMGGDDDFQPVLTEGAALVAWHQWYYAEDLSHDIPPAQRDLNLAGHRANFDNFAYFESGVQTVVDLMHKHFVQAGGDLRLQVDVEEIRYASSGSEVLTTAGVFFARKVVSGRHLTAAIQNLPEGVEPNPLNTNEYNSLMIKACFERPPAYEYINFVGHQSVGALQITQQDEPEGPSGSRVLCVIGSFGQQDPMAAAEAFVAEMAMRGVLPSSSQVLDAVFSRYVAHSHSTAYCQQVTEVTQGAIELTAIHSIGQSMTEGAAFWREALTPPSTSNG
jgi:hypothetical protein